MRSSWWCGVLWLALSGCGYAAWAVDAQPAGEAEPGFGFAAPARTAAFAADDPALMDSSLEEPLFEESQSDATARKTIHTASLSIEVARVDDALQRCVAAVERSGGFVAARDDAVLTCRVPASGFAAFVAELRGLGRVLHEALRAEDVTRQHRDLGIRLENAKASRERLLALLAKADKVEDLLRIEEQLRRLTDEIETMTAELKSLDDRIALATVTVSFTAVATARPGARPSFFDWINRIGVARVRREF